VSAQRLGSPNGSDLMSQELPKLTQKRVSWLTKKAFTFNLHTFQVEALVSSGLDNPEYICLHNAGDAVFISDRSNHQVSLKTLLKSMVRMYLILHTQITLHDILACRSSC